MNGTNYTVGALSAYLAQLRQAPGHTAKALSDIRSAARLVLKELDLRPDLRWNLDTVEEWCDTYADSDHAAARETSTAATYQSRLRTAARLLDMSQRKAEPVGNKPVWLDDLLPSPRTLHDLRLLAAAWRISPADALTKLIDFYRNFNPYAPPPRAAGDLAEDIEVHARYKHTTITGIYHRSSRNLTVTSPPVSGQRFSTPSSAAIAVVAALNPQIASANRTGYDFWVITTTGQKLRAIRRL